MVQSKSTSGDAGTSTARGAIPGTAPLDPFQRGRSGPSLSLADCAPELVIAAIDAVLSTGALLSFGLTSDGGALGVYLTNDGHRFKEWAHEPDQLEKVLQALLDWGEVTR